MLIPGVEPDLIAYKTIVLTDTLYEQKSLILVSFFLCIKNLLYDTIFHPTWDLNPEPPDFDSSIA